MLNINYVGSDSQRAFMFSATSITNYATLNYKVFQQIMIF